MSKSKTVVVTTSPYIFQKCWKKMGGMLSGPGALRGYIYFKATLISSAMNVRFSSSFMDVDTFGWIASKISVKSSGLLEVKSF